MSLVILFVALLVVLIFNENKAASVSNNTDISFNNIKYGTVKSNIDTLTEYRIILLEKEISRRVNQPVENNSRIIVNLLCSLNELKDTSEFLDAHPEVLKLIFSG